MTEHDAFSATVAAAVERQFPPRVYLFLRRHRSRCLLLLSVLLLHHARRRERDADLAIPHEIVIFILGASDGGRRRDDLDLDVVSAFARCAPAD